MTARQLKGGWRILRDRFHPAFTSSDLAERILHLSLHAVVEPGRARTSRCRILPAYSGGGTPIALELPLFLCFGRVASGDDQTKKTSFTGKVLRVALTLPPSNRKRVQRVAGLV